MKPVLLELGPLTVHGYGFMIFLGGVLVFSLLWTRRREAGLADENDFWAFANALLFAGWGGGRLVHLLFYEEPGRVLSTLFSLRSGFSVLGAFVFLPVGVAVFARLKKKSFLVLYDHVSVMAPLWHAFGRLGCFLAACCYGRPTDGPWGVAFTDPRALVPRALLGAPLHPAQLYEAAGDLLIAACLWPVLKSSRRPGLVTALYYAAYGILRASLETVRADTAPLAWGLTAGQGVALAMFAFSGGILYWRARCSPSC